MEPYTFCLWLGFAGLVAMALLGLGHHGHDGGGHAHHGHDAHAHSGHSGHAHDAGALHGHDTAHAHHTAATHHGASSHQGEHGHHSPAHDSRDAVAKSLLSWLSPRVLFSVLVGFGAAGTIGRMLIPQPMLVLALAVCGGIGFEKLIVSPLWSFFFRFASNPARTLTSSVLEEARAVTNFDSSGSGLIAIDLDGQVVQVLGTLRPDERAAQIPVHTGDRLMIEAVDETSNRCTVSKLSG